ncbi:sigma-70 family RNA polymerase sigma factor [Planctomicrobium sp. SH527]|uniref:sigma-70 family RNA polymerase sigma factor n=1 Tax=Planctomicrobium sp. SH527 TaxID=3448123 RepID=UPI003F5B5370
MSTMQSVERCYELFLREFARDRSKLFRYIFSLLPNHADAEDVFQRCSLVLWQKFSEFDTERNFFAWARGIAFNEVRYFIRTNQQQRLKFDTELLSEISDIREAQLDSSGEILAHISDCLKRLPFRDRTLVRQAYGKSQTIKSFAESSCSAPQTIYNNLGRIRRLIQACVQKKLVTG